MTPSTGTLVGMGGPTKMLGALLGPLARARDPAVMPESHGTPLTWEKGRPSRKAKVVKTRAKEKAKLPSQACAGKMPWVKRA